MFTVKKILTILLLVIINTQAFAQMSGNYTINSAEPTGATNFNSFNDLSIALSTNGISGNVEINVVKDSGPYNEQVIFNPVAGTEKGYHIRLNAGGEKLIYSPNSENAKYIVQLNGINNLTIDSLIVEIPADATYGWGFHLKGATNNVTLLECSVDVKSSPFYMPHTFYGFIGTNSNTEAGILSENFGKVDILDCVVNNAVVGIDLIGSVKPNCRIEGNTILQAYIGVNLFSLNAPIIGQNYIQLKNQTFTESYGFKLERLTNNFRLYSNKIIGVNKQGAAIKILSCNNNTSNPSLIFNNAAWGFYNLGGDGMYVGDDTKRLAIFNNSIHINSPKGSALVLNSTKTNSIKNLEISNNAFASTQASNPDPLINIISNKNNGLSIDTIDHNAYYAVNANPFKVNTFNYNSLATFKTFVGNNFVIITANPHDANSLLEDPKFKADDNLSLEYYSNLINKANANYYKLYASIMPMDINYKQRAYPNEDKLDIGAYELDYTKTLIKDIAFDIVCEDTPTSLQATLNYLDVEGKIYWDFGDDKIIDKKLPLSNETLTQSYIFKNTAKTVRVKVENRFGDVVELTKNIALKPKPNFTYEATNITCDQLGKIELKIPIADDYVFEWSDGSKERDLLNIKQPNGYSVKITDKEGCQAQSDEIIIKGECETPIIYDVFTPNGDGVNDTWTIQNIEFLFPDNEVYIYNRNGNLVFHSKGYKQPFDGTFNGKILPSETYFYVVKLNKTYPPLTGTLILVR